MTQININTGPLFTVKSALTNDFYQKGTGSILATSQPVKEFTNEIPLIKEMEVVDVTDNYLSFIGNSHPEIRIFKVKKIISL